MSRPPPPEKPQAATAEATPAPRQEQTGATRKPGLSNEGAGLTWALFGRWYIDSMEGD